MPKFVMKNALKMYCITIVVFFVFDVCVCQIEKEIKSGQMSKREIRGKGGGTLVNGGKCH